MNLVFVVGIVQHRVEFDLVDLAHGTEIAGDQLGHFLVALALRTHQVAKFERFASVADQQLHIALQGALMNAKDPKLADEGIQYHLEYMSQHMALRVGHRAKGFRRRALTLEEQRRVAFHWTGCQSRKDIEQLANPGTTASRDEAQRNQMALAQRSLKGRVQLFRADLALFEVARHQLLVYLDHLIHQGLVRLLNRGKVSLTLGIEETIHHSASALGREVERQYLFAESLTQVS
ncbi:hypothetical protein D9M68_668160 [compost metagenome]